MHTGHTGNSNFPSVPFLQCFSVKFRTGNFSIVDLSVGLRSASVSSYAVMSATVCEICSKKSSATCDDLKLLL